MNNSKITVSIIKSVTAILCCASLAIGAAKLTDKVCDTQKNIAAVSSGEAAHVSGGEDDFSSDINSGDTSAADGNTADVSDGADSSEQNGSQASDSASSDKNKNSSGSAEATAKKISLADGLTSTDKAEVLKFYQLAAKKNADKKVKKSLVLVSMEGGKGISDSAISFFEPIAKKALEANSNKEEAFPGKPAKITADDWLSATATNDGTYTTLNIKVKPQTDGPYGQEFEGSVGRSMGVLNGFGRAVDEMSMVSADFKNGKVDIQYLNPVIKIKVKNATGELVKDACEWSYRTHPTLYYLDAKVTVFNVHLEGANGYIDYILKY